MWDVQATPKVYRTSLAAFTYPYFFGASSKHVETRKHNSTSFIRPLAVILLASVAQAVIVTVQSGGVPNIQPMAATLMYILALLLQIDYLWSPKTKDKEDGGKVHPAFLGTWTTMAVFESLAIVKLAVAPRSPNVDLVGAVASGLRFCMVILLLVAYTWPDRGGHIRPGDVKTPPDAAAAAEGDPATAGSNGDNSEGDKRPALPVLQRSVSDEIRAAGGPWLWMKKFSIFLPWIWPGGMSWKVLYIIVALLLRLSETALELYIPRVEGAFADCVGQAYSNKELGPLWGSLWLLLVMRFASSGNGITTVRRLLWQKVKHDRDERARIAIHAYLMDHEAAFHFAVDLTDITAAVDKGIKVFNALDYIVFDVMPKIISLIGASMALFSLYGPHVMLVEGFTFALHMLITIRSNRMLMPALDEQTTAYQDTERQRQSGLRGWQTVALHGQSQREIETYATSLSKETKLMWKKDLIHLGFQFGSSLVINLGNYAAMIFVILHGFLTGGTLGSVVEFKEYSDLLQTPLFFLTQVPEHMFKELHSADHLRRLLQIKPTMTYGTNDLHLAGGRVEFKNVTFSYTDTSGMAKPVFKGLNLVIEQGKTTALVGPSGVGKSTIGSLIARLYDAQEGSIEIDGQDVKTLKKNELSKYIAVMAQTSYLFNDTVKYNIRYGRPDTTAVELDKVSNMAGIHPSITGRKNGYDAMVGEDGGSFSGGERQRLALARTFAARTSVLILDEATSAVDANTEADVKESIKANFDNKTTIIIAHRMSSIVDADKIVYLKKGKDGHGEVAEEGKHDELVKLGGLYAQLWKKYIGGTESNKQMNSAREEASIENLIG